GPRFRLADERAHAVERPAGKPAVDARLTVRHGPQAGDDGAVVRHPQTRAAPGDFLLDMVAPERPRTLRCRRQELPCAVEAHRVEPCGSMSTSTRPKRTLSGLPSISKRR